VDICESAALMDFPALLDVARTGSIATIKFCSHPVIDWHSVPQSPPKKELNGVWPKVQKSQDLSLEWICQACCGSYTQVGSLLSGSVPIRLLVGIFCPAEPSSKELNRVVSKA